MCALTDPQYSSGNSVISNIGNAFAGIDSSLGLSKTVTALVNNPLPTLETMALTYFAGIPPEVASAIVTAANGGNMEQIATSMATAYIAGKVGDTAATKFSSSDFAASVKSMDPTLAKVLTQTVSSASGSAAVAAIQGKNLTDVLAAAANGAVTSYVSQSLTKQQTTNRKQQTANGKQQTANSKQQTANRKPQTANRKPLHPTSHEHGQMSCPQATCLRALMYLIAPR